MATSKPPTIASLVRTAAKSHKIYIDNTVGIFVEDDTDRIVEYFGRLSLPRAWEDEETAEWPPEAVDTASSIAREHLLMAGITKYIERNVRKIKWHISHPGEGGAQASADAVALVFEAQAEFAKLRLRRCIKLINESEVLSAEDWGKARELMNRGFRDYRTTVQLIANKYLEQLFSISEREEALEALAGYPQMIRKHTADLDELREQVEEARLASTVQPEGYPPVAPPRYFGGDLLDSASWKYFWGEVGNLSDNIRQQVGLGI
jgi:hypothetical protein